MTDKTGTATSVDRHPNSIPDTSLMGLSHVFTCIHPCSTTLLVYTMVDLASKQILWMLLWTLLGYGLGVSHYL